MRVSITVRLVFFTLLLAGCTACQATPAGQEALPTAGEVGRSLPPTITPFPPGYPWPPTEMVTTRRPLPSPTVGPTPIVLGAEWAPEAEREVYVSTTVVVAPVGDGPGEIGYWEMPEAGRVWADRFTVDAHGNIYILDKVNHRVAIFDPDGRFLENVPYDHIPGWRDVIDLAADGEGNLYLLYRDDGVKSLDRAGRVLQEYPRPSWLLSILGIRVDEQGILWSTGNGILPEAPVIEGQPYSKVSVPLGSAYEVFDTQYQVGLAIPGRLLRTGGPVITYSFGGYSGDYSYIYNRQGQPVYRYLNTLLAIDRYGSLYTMDEDEGILAKYGHQGEQVSLLKVTAKPSVSAIVMVNDEGSIYALLWDFETKDAYRVIRWVQK